MDSANRVKAIVQTAKILIPVTLLSVTVACNAQLSESADRWMESMQMRAPTKSDIYICHAFGCKLKYRFRPSKSDKAKLARIIASGKRTPKAERQAIGKAVQWFENRVGPVVGSDKDIGGLDLSNAGTPGQMDCVDEASNTTALVMYMQMHGMLKHHRFNSPVARGFFLDGRYPHATAVVQETKSKKRYAVDSWVHDNGKFPVIKPLEVWMAEKPAGLSS